VTDEADDRNELDEPPRQTAIRVACECGGALGVLVLPCEEVGFVATCAGCGTHYRRPMHELVRRAIVGEVVTVVLPRSRPRG
jgi:hypothetical protein